MCLSFTYLSTVKLQTPDHVRSVKILKNPELSWSGNFLVVNIVGPKVMCAGGLLVRKLLILGLAISIRYTHMNCVTKFSPEHR